MKRFVRPLFRVLITVGSVYLLAALLLFFFQDRIIFPGQALNCMPDAGQGVAGLERLWIEQVEGRSEAWFLPALDASNEKPAGLLVFTHGNNELIDSWPSALRTYRRMGFHVLLPEYRGFGRSEGNPSEAAIVSDIEQLLKSVLARPDVDPTRLVYHGRSIGTGVACALARVRKPRAIVLQSPFVSLTEMAHRMLMPGFLLRSPFESQDALQALGLSVLIFHGDVDKVVPTQHGRRLHDALPGSRFVLQSCNHGDCPPDLARHFEHIASFLEAEKLL